MMLSGDDRGEAHAAPRYPHELYVEQVGHGPPLLILHGFTGSTAEWDEVAPLLMPHATLLKVDLLGHGRSPAPVELDAYRMEQAVTDLLALLDRNRLEQVALLGYSMGGRVALHLAAAAPERVTALILASASPGLAEAQERAVRRASDEALADRIEQQGLAWFVDYWTNIPLFTSQARLPSATRAALRARRLRGTAHGYAQSLRGMGTGHQRSLWEELPQLTMPTLLITGMLDQKFVAINEQMAEALPNVVHVRIAEAGHTVHLEQPQAFCEVVVRFLDQGCNKNH